MARSGASPCVAVHLPSYAYRNPWAQVDDIYQTPPPPPEVRLQNPLYLTTYKPNVLIRLADDTVITPAVYRYQL